jgi:predicted small metal-binding protein
VASSNPVARDWRKIRDARFDAEVFLGVLSKQILWPDWPLSHLKQLHSGAEYRSSAKCPLCLPSPLLKTIERQSNDGKRSGVEISRGLRVEAMKTMTCEELGGSCDQELSAASWNEMVKAMVYHVDANHPDVAKQMEAMHNKDPHAWEKEMKPKWDAAPEA